MKIWIQTAMVTLTITGSRMCLSADALDDWTSVRAPNYYSVPSICHGSPGFVAATTAGLMFSPDGTRWTNSASVYAIAVCYGTGGYVAVGQYSAFQSPDGIHWVERLVGSNHGTITSISFGAGRFIASSTRGAVWESEDGVGWAYLRDLTNGVITSVSFSEQGFIAVGDTGLVATSADGRAWTTEILEQPTYLNCGYSVGGITVVGGNNGRVYRRRDGGTWQDVSFFNNPNTSIGYGSGRFLMAGGQVLWTSFDGINWVGRPIHSSANLTAVAYGDGRVVCGSTSGEIVRSGLLPEPSEAGITDIGLFSGLLINGSIGETYTIQISDDPSGPWSPVGTVTVVAQPTRWYDPNPAARSKRFYRAIR